MKWYDEHELLEYLCLQTGQGLIGHDNRTTTVLTLERLVNSLAILARLALNI